MCGGLKFKGMERGSDMRRSGRRHCNDDDGSDDDEVNVVIVVVSVAAVLKVFIRTTKLDFAHVIQICK